ncbi:MAG: transcriptional regulator, partial [Pseudobdellovibrionaceae bacterium]
PIAEAQNTEQPKPVDGATKEIIVEALDKVNIEFTIDNGRTVKMSLQPGEVQIIKAKNSVKLTASEGKAINVTQNGRDRGVPGSVGKPINLNYP